MKKKLCIFLVTTFFLNFMIGCTSQPIVINSHLPEPDSFKHFWKSEARSHLLFFLTTAVIAVTGLLLVQFLHPKKVKLTPKGVRVRLLIHDEAPQGATFLGEINSRVRVSAICVKNDLRNQAALMGGNLVVVDNINSVVLDGRSSGYSGSGRVYYVSSRKGARQENRQRDLLL